MSIAAHAKTNYGTDTQVLKSPREVEYDLLARITGRMKAHLPHDPGRTDLGLIQALQDNRRLWTAFAADLAHQDNAFPSELRARLFFLAEFSLAHTSRVLAGQTTADVLVEINTSIMRGLRGQKVTR